MTIHVLVVQSQRAYGQGAASIMGRSGAGALGPSGVLVVGVVSVTAPR